ncbi:MAG: DUF4832 domain-containing protein [Myxococcota bacterium]|nr:DUF4832 domain-containing protein [Myxococcota bacterium]
MRTIDRSARVALLLVLLSACGPGVIEGDDAGRRDASTTRDAATTDAAPPSDAAPGADTGTEPPLVRSTDFAEAAGDVLNPDRGMYWWDWSSTATLVLVKVQLGAYCGTATLPSSVTTELRARMDAHRTAGRRAILRFVYADGGVVNEACMRADAESIEIVEGHIAQLAAAMEEHVDVIAYVEAGFFGMWGEWNSEHAPAGTSLWTSEENRRRVLRALLDAVPEERAILVRRPRFREELPFPPADLARLGFHNDCFLASADDYGTYDGDRSVAEWKTYVREATTTVPLGGETCRDELPFTTCENALSELETLRWSYLHEGYHEDVIARWESEGCMDEIRRRLGYRIVLRAVEAPVEVPVGGVLRVRMELDNEGYAPPYTTRRARLVLRNEAGATHVIEPLESTGADTRAWVPGATIEVELAAVLPAALEPGTWEVRVALLEDRSDAPAYAMIFANDERVRDDARRENVIATLVVP